jgi:hypothetical protein
VNFDGSEPELCRRCRFDSRQWRRQDASTVLERLGSWWRLATADLSADRLNQRPAPGVWSALEYGLHSAMVLPILRDEIEVMLAHDGAEVRDPCPDLDIEDASRPLTLDPASILDALEREGAILSRLVDTRPDGWAHLGRMDDGTWWQAEATLLHIVHDTTHHFLDVGEGLVRIGAALPVAESTVESVSLAGRVEGARHPRPFEAVGLWSSEMIAALGKTGDAIGADQAEENLTLSGIDWASLRPGTRVLAGTALLELSYRADPGAEWAGWYAWVRQQGRIRPGDSAVISPAQTRSAEP